ncbi:NmrA family NAD(P)-binding protein, partial [Streptomyces sp. NPDC002740]
MESEIPMTTTLPVLVVGATGSLGGKVVDELLERGKKVRALVRPASDASRLESRGVQIARGDML